MPTRAFRPYAYDHQVHHAKVDAQRANDPIRKLYRTPTWRATRLLVLSRDPVCKRCDTATSTIVHHIIPARKHVALHGNDMSYFFDESNLEAVCKPCHDSITAKECNWAGHS